MFSAMSASSHGAIYDLCLQELLRLLQVLFISHPMFFKNKFQNSFVSGLLLNQANLYFLLFILNARVQDEHGQTKPSIQLEENLPLVLLLTLHLPEQRQQFAGRGFQSSSSSNSASLCETPTEICLATGLTIEQSVPVLRDVAAESQQNSSPGKAGNDAKNSGSETGVHIKVANSNPPGISSPGVAAAGAILQQILDPGKLLATLHIGANLSGDMALVDGVPQGSNASLEWPSRVITILAVVEVLLNYILQEPQVMHFVRGSPGRHLKRMGRGLLVLFKIEACLPGKPLYQGISLSL